MPLWMKAAGKWGSIFVVIALVITLLKQMIAFIGIVTGAIKIIIILAFVAVIAFVGFLIISGIRNSKRSKE